jgi:hypothetical protein
VPGHVKIDGNEIADELAKQGPSHPLTGPALGIPAKVARGVKRLAGNVRNIGSPYVGKGKLRALKKTCGTVQPEHKPAKNTDSGANRTISFKKDDCLKWGW